MITITDMEKDNVSELAEIVSRNNLEIYGVKRPMTTEILLRDGFGKKFEMVTAKAGAALIGFAVWTQTYDIHFGITGASVQEMYVLPEWRGKCVAVLLAARIASLIGERGWTFINTMAEDDNSRAQRLYHKLAISSKGFNYIVANKALRGLAALDGKTGKEIVKNWPHREWNEQE